MLLLKQSTAVDVVLGPFVDDTDGKTPETGLTISQADCQLTKNAAAVAQKNDATAASHLGGGHYKVPLNTTDTNTLGRLRLYVNESGALPAWLDFMVMPANVWDSLFSTDLLQVDLTQVVGAAVSTSTAQLGVNAVQAGGTAWGSGAITAAAIATGAIDADAIADNAIDAGAIATGAITAAKFAAGAIDAAAIADNAIDAGAIAAGAITGAKFAAGAIDATALATTAVDEIVDAVWDEALAGHATAGTAGKKLSDAGAAGDPWATVVPGSYGAGTAGKRLGDLSAAGDPWATAVPGSYGAGTAGKILGDKAFNANQIGGSATAATNAARGFQGLVLAKAVTGTLTTTAFTTNLTEATNDHYNGRALTFTSGALAGQQTTITDYDGATKRVTVAAMTEAPANNDEFTIA